MCEYLQMFIEMKLINILLECIAAFAHTIWYKNLFILQKKELDWNLELN